MSGYEDLAHTTYKVSGNNLVITAKGWDDNGKNVTYGTITIKNFAKSNVVGNEGSVTLKLADGVIDLNDIELDIRGVKKSYKGSRFDEYIEADEATKAITITGGKGDDYIVGNNGHSKKAMTFTFSSGDGNDRISNTKVNDVIRIDTVGKPTYTNVGGDLLIGYGNGDSILVSGYFLAEDDDRIDTLKVKNANGGYDTLSLAEETDIEEVKKTVKNVKINDGEIVIPANSEYTTINFVGYTGFTGISTYGPNYTWEGKNDDNLYIAYGNTGDMIILEDYVKNKGNHPIKNIIVGGVTYEVPLRYYTTANDGIIAPATEDQLYLSGGNHTVTFSENNNYHIYDYIYSEGAAYTDTLVLNDYSFENGEIEIGRELSNTGSLIIHANDGENTDTTLTVKLLWLILLMKMVLSLWTEHLLLQQKIGQQKLKVIKTMFCL